MDEHHPVSEYYDNEWDVPGDRPAKSPLTLPAGYGIAGNMDEDYDEAVFLASIRAWISGYLSH